MSYNIRTSGRIRKKRRYDPERDRSLTTQIHINYGACPGEIRGRSTEVDTVFFDLWNGPLVGDGSVYSPNIEVEVAQRLDAFEIRDEFVDIQESRARRFLEKYGPFWPLGPVTWRQFREWQEFVCLVRQESFLKQAEFDGRALDAMCALTGSPSRFFKAPDFEPPAHEEESIRIATKLAGVPADAFAKDRSRRIIALCRWFLNPPTTALSFDYAFPPRSLERAQNDSEFRDLLERALRRPELSEPESGALPVLIIKANNILEAIAATVFADRCHGAKYRKCDYCGALFRIESDHGRKYCRWLRSDGSVVESCRNNASQAFSRKRLKDEKDKAKSWRIDKSLEKDPI